MVPEISSGKGRGKWYPKYKDSGVEWLGEVPEGWSFGKIRYFAEILTGGTPSKDRLDYWENGSINWMSSGEVSKKIVTEIEKKITPLGMQNSNAKILPVNSVMIALNGQGKTKGTAAILKVPSTCNQSLAAIVCNSKRLHYFYLFFYLESRYKEIRGLVGDDMRDGLNLDIIRSLPVYIPPLLEQTTIANFLDRESTRIDALIEKKERQIELLQEKRMAIISHAVTKGLAPNAKMKDSGVEWIGGVPEHWEIIKIKHFCSVKRGASPRPIDDPKYFDDNGDYAWVRISDVTASQKYLEKTEQNLSNLGKRYSVPLEPGEIFLSMAATIGKPIITQIKCCIHDGFVYFLRLKQDREFLFYLFLCGNMFQGLGKWGTQLNLNTDTIGEINIPVPPYLEQSAIAKYLDDETARFDALIEKIRHSINLLKEYRNTLISAAVTGKIDVRGEVPV